MTFPRWVLHITCDIVCPSLQDSLCLFIQESCLFWSLYLRWYNVLWHCWVHDVIATHVSCVYLRCIIMCVDHYACDILLGVYNTAPVGLGVCVWRWRWFCVCLRASDLWLLYGRVWVVPHQCIWATRVVVCVCVCDIMSCVTLCHNFPYEAVLWGVVCTMIKVPPFLPTLRIPA